MQTILLLVHVLAAVGMVGLILMQHGKGADAGAAFGSGASATVFGSQGAGSFVTRLTAGLATLFFITSLSLAYFSGQTKEAATSVVDRMQVEKKVDIPLPAEQNGLFEAVESMTSGTPGIPQPQEEQVAAEVEEATAVVESNPVQPSAVEEAVIKVQTPQSDETKK